MRPPPNHTRARCPFDFLSMPFALAFAWLAATAFRFIRSSHSRIPPPPPPSPSCSPLPPPFLPSLPTCSTHPPWGDGRTQCLRRKERGRVEGQCPYARHQALAAIKVHREGKGREGKGREGGKGRKRGRKRGEGRRTAGRRSLQWEDKLRCIHPLPPSLPRIGRRRQTPMGRHHKRGPRARRRTRGREGRRGCRTPWLPEASIEARNSERARE